jgi:hypothetical protein
MKLNPSLRSLIDQPEDHDTNDEHYEDAPDSDDEAPAKSKSTSEDAPSSVYNAHHRDPRYCGADVSCLWELTVVRFRRSFIFLCFLLLK